MLKIQRGRKGSATDIVLSGAPRANATVIRCLSFVSAGQILFLTWTDWKQLLRPELSSSVRALTSASNGRGLYVRTRPSTSGQSMKRVEAMYPDSTTGRRSHNVHPWFSENRASVLAAEVSHCKPKTSDISNSNVLCERNHRRIIRAPRLVDCNLAILSARARSTCQWWIRKPLLQPRRHRPRNGDVDETR